MYRSIQIILILLVFIFSGCRLDEKEVDLKQPNIVFIIADDLGYSQLGCYGSDYYKTPNIDDLAKTGMRFTNAYAAAAVCSPTRASIVTGKYPARLNLTDYIPGDKNRSNLLEIPEWQKFLPLEELTVGEVLKSEGYKTAWFGKWHLSKSKQPPESIENNPENQGFDESFVTYKPNLSSPIKDWQTPENDGHNVEILTNKSIDFIDRNKESPFFLVISHNTIHDPLMEKASLIDKYNKLEATNEQENNSTIAAMIETLDNSVGRIINKINESKIDNNTIIIFYSDNGGLDKYAKQTPFRKGKGWLYEGGIHVPLIISYKGVIAPNSVNDQLVSSIDFFPTFSDFSYAERYQKLPIDGLSLAPLLLGEKVALRKNLYWNYPHYHSSGMKPASAIRSGDFKLIEWYEAKYMGNQNVYELYNLVDDPGEKNDLSSKLPGKVNELKHLLEEWKIDVNAQEPSINKNSSGEN
jgi:arylsulfatase A